MPDTILDPIHAAAQRDPEAPAVIGPEGMWTYADLDRRVEAAARALADRGIEAGNRVATYLPRTPAHVVVLMAVLRQGAVAAPLSTRLPAAQVPARLRQIQGQALVTDDDHLLEHGEGPRYRLSAIATSEVSDTQLPARRLALHQPATIVFTSGSTGTPKAALHTLGNHYYNATGSATNIPLEAGDRWLLSLPLYHVGGLAIGFRCVLAGAGIVLPASALPGSNVPLHETIRAYQVTHVSLVATQLRRLLQSGAPVDTLRALLVGGGPIPEGLIDEAHDRGWPIHTTYGCTEMASQVTTTPPGATRATLSTAGAVLPHRELKIAEDGELLVRGATLFAGYVDGDALHDPCTADGWYPTGDRGTLDADGHLHVHGRTDHMFVSGGENIHPEEIERVLMQLGGITRAVVVPVPDEEFGARPVAFVEAGEQADGQGVGRERVAAWRRKLDEALPRYKRPVRFLPWPDDESGSSIKADRAALRKRAQAQVGANKSS